MPCQGLFISMLWDGIRKRLAAMEVGLTSSWQFMQSDSISSTGLTSSSVDSVLPTGATWSTCAPMAWKYSVEDRTPLFVLVVAPLVTPFAWGGSTDMLILDLGEEKEFQVVCGGCKMLSQDGVGLCTNFWRGNRMAGNAYVIAQKVLVGL